MWQGSLLHDALFMESSSRGLQHVRAIAHRRHVLDLLLKTLPFLLVSFPSQNRRPFQRLSPLIARANNIHQISVNTSFVSTTQLRQRRQR